MQKIIIFDWLHSVSSGIASFGWGWVATSRRFCQGPRCSVVGVCHLRKLWLTNRMTNQKSEHPTNRQTHEGPKGRCYISNKSWRMVLFRLLLAIHVAMVGTNSRYSRIFPLQIYRMFQRKTFSYFTIYCLPILCLGLPPSGYKWQPNADQMVRQYSENIRNTLYMLLICSL